MNTNNLLLGILMIAIFGVGFMIGRFTADGDSYSSKSSPDSSVSTSESSGSDVVAEEGGTTINASSLTDSQRKMLSSLGIDADSITVTPEMIACAEAELGASRVNEITNGASPSFGEGLKLVACYK